MIRNAELARAISEKFGLSAKEAENFVSTMIEIVNDALRYERQVKIKGLGTFKVLGVESRESVDVNTGRRITIGERDKISFTPDVTLRDRVNSPFAQFETFVINDDVDFSEIDARYASGENISVMPKDDEEDKPSDVVAAFVAPAPVAIEEEKPQEEPTIPNNKPEEMMTQRPAGSKHRAQQHCHQIPDCPCRLVAPCTWCRHLLFHSSACTARQLYPPA